MIDAAATLSRMPSSDDYASAARRRRRAGAFWTLLLAAACASSFVAFGVDNILLPLSVLLCLLTPVLLWHYPRLALYATFGAACLLETMPSDYADALTDRVPFFWNVNTIVQRYAHADFSAIPLSLFELFILSAAVCSLLRAVFSGNVRLRGGVLLGPMALYIGCVVFGWANGMTSGGDFKLSLQEVRAQFYLLFAYLMGVNLLQEKRQIGGLFWTFALCVGLKGILLTFRRYATLAGLPIPDQGVGAHEEAFFFDAFAVLLAVLSLCRAYKKLQYVMWALLPFVLTGNLACNRRAATAAMVVIVPVLLLAAYRALPERRRMVGGAALALIVGFSIYYPAFRNSGSLIGQPARAIQSQFSPDARDASSNAYRDAENADLMATVKSAPLLGYGYGKHMLHAVPIADISKDYEWWDIMTHNSIVWVWMRTGTLGFVAFWIMVSAVILQACGLLRDEQAGGATKSVGMFGLLVIGMLMIFGLLDLQLANVRDMLFTGVWAGAVGAVASLTAQEKPRVRPGRLG